MNINDKFEAISRESENWRVFIQPQVASFNVKIWLIEKRGNEIYNAIVVKGLIQLKKILGKEGIYENPPCFLEIPMPVWKLIVDAITNTTEPIKQEIVNAEVKLLKDHLSDMRKIVAKKIGVDL